MKRYLLIFALLLGAVSSRGQAVADQAAVLQKCLGLLPQATQLLKVDPVSTTVSGYALEVQMYFDFSSYAQGGNQAYEAFGYWPCTMGKLVNPLYLQMQEGCGLSTNLETNQTRR